MPSGANAECPCIAPQALGLPYVSRLFSLFERVAEAVEHVRCGLWVIRLSNFLTRSGSLRREFALPPSNDNAGDTIAEYGDSSSPHIHQLIDGEEKK